MKKMYQILSLIFFILGLFFITNTQANITGAVVGVSISSSAGFFVGVCLIIVAVILFFSGYSRLETEIKLSSAIGKDKSLTRLAKKATKDQYVQKEIDHLVDELNKGNLEAGLGHPEHIEGTDIFYLKGKRGGRLYYHQTKDGYEIVGKSSKDKKNQDAVMKRLREIYCH